MSKKGKKSLRSQGELYNEVKAKRISLKLTPTALSNLDDRAKVLGISRSEVVERLARDIGPQVDNQTPEDNDKKEKSCSK